MSYTHPVVMDFFLITDNYRETRGRVRGVSAVRLRYYYYQLRASYCTRQGLCESTILNGSVWRKKRNFTPTFGNFSVHIGRLHSVPVISLPHGAVTKF